MREEGLEEGGMAGSRRALALVVNSGARSVRFGVFSMGLDQGEVSASEVMRGSVSWTERSSRMVLDEKKGDERQLTSSVRDHVGAMESILEVMEEVPSVVGHRVVHGGPDAVSPARVDDALVRAVGENSPLAPLHNPACLLGMSATRQVFPEVCEAAVFDTAFHTRSMEPEAYRYAVPDEFYEAGLRRYGFHGTCYQNVISKMPAALTRRSVVLYLGRNGSSACCVRDGKSVDTSMGLTPLEGLVMGSRCGDLDAGAVSYISSKLHSSPDEVTESLNTKSGLLGLSGGLSSEMSEIASAAEAGNEKARLARAIYAERARKYLGAYLVKLGGHIDSLVFTGLVGETDSAMRQMICDDLLPLGIALDHVKNSLETPPQLVSTSFSRTKVLVVESDQEKEIAIEAARCAGILDDQIAEAARAAKQALLVTPKQQEQEEAALAAATTVAPLGRAVYVDGSGPTACEEVGLLYQVLSSCGGNIGYFRPFANDDDRKLATVRELFQLAHALDEMRGCDVATAEAKLAAGREDELLDLVVGKFVEYASTKDFVVVSRGHLGLEGDHQWTAKVASALGIPVVYSVRASSRDDLNQTAARVKTALDANSIRFAGIVALLPEEPDAQVFSYLRDTLGVVPALVSARVPEFAEVTMAEIGAVIPELTTLCQADQSAVINGVVIATRHTADVVEVLQGLPPGQLVVTHASRADLVLSLVLANQSTKFPSIAGLLLSGTDGGDESIGASHFGSTLDLITSLSSSINLPPIVCVPGSTYDAAKAVHEMVPVLLPSSSRKIEAAQVLFEKRLDPGFRSALLPCVNRPKGEFDHRSDPSPKLFQHQLFAKARANRKRIVLPEGDDARVVKAASELLRRELCDVVLLGDPEKLASLAAESRLDLSKATIVDTRMEPPSRLVDGLVKAREHKGMTREVAATLLRDDPNYYGTMMLHLGEADGMVSGACHSTASTMRPALQIVKMQPGVTIASSVFFMLLQSGVKVFGDCAINVSPSSSELAQIAAASARTARAFGIDPRVAMLSYATGDSNKGALIDKVREATEAARLLAPSELFEGPIQFDAAVDPAVASVKYKNAHNAVAGKANVLIFPTLDAGNSAYKAVQQASRTIAVGPVMQGLRKPVNDLSRGCTVDDVVNTVVVTCLQAAAATNNSEDDEKH